MKPQRLAALLVSALLSCLLPAGSAVAAVITAVLPPNGSIAGGTAVTIVGSGFTNATTATFGGMVVSNLAVINDNILTLVTGAHSAGTVDVVIYVDTFQDGQFTGWQTYTGSQAYTYGTAAPPTGAAPQAGAVWVNRTLSTSTSLGTNPNFATNHLSWTSIASSADGIQLSAATYCDIVSSQINGAIWTSTDSGATWTNRTINTVADGRSWTSVAASADGSKLAATAWGEDIWTSADYGLTWTNRTKGSGRLWQSITSSASGTFLAATVHEGDIWTSTDSGLTWTDRSTGSYAWSTIACSADGTFVVAGQQGGDIWTSADSGATWTQHTNGMTARDWNVACSADGSRLVAAMNGGDIWTSADSGTTWTNRTTGTVFSGRTWSTVSSSADGYRLAAAGASKLSTSADGGITWTDRTSKFVGAISDTFSAIGSSADGSKLAVTLAHSDIFTSPDAPQIAVSIDGVAIPNGQGNPIDIGSATLLGAQATRTFTITNNGATRLIVADPTQGAYDGNFPPVPVDIGVPGEFKVTTQPSLSVPVGGSATFAVTFHPMVPGQAESSVTVYSNDPATPSYTFHVTGTGLPSTKQPQTITFDLPATAYVGQSPLFILGGLHSSTGSPPSLSVLSGPATFNPLDGSLTLTGTGTVKLQATLAGDTYHAAAPPVTRTLVVKADPTALTLLNLSQTYDGNPKPVATLGGTGTPVITYKVGAAWGSDPPVNAGSYPVKAVAGSSAVTGTLIIAKAPLYIVPIDEHKFVGQANPMLTFSYYGFIGTDYATATPVLATTATIHSVSGLYPITVSGGGEPNYTPIYQQGTLVVDGFAGSYEALLLDPNNLPVAKLSLTIPAACTSFTARLYTATLATSVPFTGPLTLGTGPFPGTTQATGVANANVTVNKLTAPYDINFTLTPFGDLSVTAGHDGAPFATSIDGQKLSTRPVNFAGVHTAVLEPPTWARDYLPSDPLVDAGAGWATAGISSTGVLTLAGQLGDGTAFTCALSPDGQVNPGYRLFAQPYVPARPYSFLGGEFNLLQHPILNNRRYLPPTAMIWAKMGLPADPSYRTAVDTVKTLLMIDPWLPPAAAIKATRTTAAVPAISLAQRLGLTGAGISFGVNETPTGSAQDVSLPTQLNLSSTNAVSVPLATPANPTHWTTTLNPATGTFTGSFSLVDSKVTRAVTFSGVLRQPATNQDALIGDGHYLLPPLSGTEKSTGEVMFTRP